MVPYYENANAIEAEAYLFQNNGTAYADASEAFKQVVMHYANTRASSSMASAALVMWRFATFILPLTAAGIVTAFYRASPSKEIVHQERMAGRQTLVDLQRETYSDRAAMVETMVETSRLTRESIARRLKALAKSDRRKKAKEKEEAEENIRTNNDYTDVTINDGDDSL